jgi:hypothetical protein
VLLYENLDIRPNDELMLATSRPTTNSLSDDDEESNKFRRKCGQMPVRRGDGEGAGAGALQ